MTYHIKQIINNSVKSVAIVNQHSSPDGRDSQIVLPDRNVGIANPIEIQHLTLSGTISYESAATQKILNVYTALDNWFLWDNGKSALIGVREGLPNDNSTLYKGEGTNLVLTIRRDGQIEFAKA